jgi:hypothetical protein
VASGTDWEHAGIAVHSGGAGLRCGSAPAPRGASAASARAIGKTFSSACSSRGRSATSAASAPGSNAPSRPTEDTAGGGLQSSTSPTSCLRADSAPAWPMRASRSRTVIQHSTRHRESGSDWEAPGMCWNRFRPGRRECTGGPMIGCAASTTWPRRCGCEIFDRCRENLRLPEYSPARRPPRSGSRSRCLDSKLGRAAPTTGPARFQ